MSFSFVIEPEIESSLNYGAFKVLRGNAVAADYQLDIVRDALAIENRIPEISVESSEFIKTQDLNLNQIQILGPGSIQSYASNSSSFRELCYCDDPLVSIHVVANKPAREGNCQGFLPDIIVNGVNQLSDGEINALRLIEVCDRSGGTKKALDLYKEFLEGLNDACLFHHHRNAGSFNGIPWLPMRFNVIREKKWGKKYVRAEEFEREHRINFSYIKNPLHRAMAFILQRDGDVNEYEESFRSQFQMKGSMKENSLKLIDSLSQKQVYRKRIDKTSTDFLRFAVDGVSPEKMKEEIGDQFRSEDSNSLPINVDQYFENIESDPILKRLIRSNAKDN